MLSLSFLKKAFQCATNRRLVQEHIKLSLVGMPVVGLTPLAFLQRNCWTSFLSTTSDQSVLSIIALSNLAADTCAPSSTASVKSAYSKFPDSMSAKLKSAPLNVEPSAKLAKKDTPLKFALSKLHCFIMVFVKSISVRL